MSQITQYHETNRASLRRQAQYRCSRPRARHKRCASRQM